MQSSISTREQELQANGLRPGFSLIFNRNATITANSVMDKPTISKTGRRISTSSILSVSLETNKQLEGMAPLQSNASSGPAGPTGPTPIKAILHDDPKRKKSKKKLASAQYNSKSVGLFSHLVQYSGKEPVVSVNVHPAIVKFALRSANYVVLGGSQRCKEMLEALRQAIGDFRSNPEMAICRHLDSYLKPMIGHMVEARPMAISMANAVRALRNQISILPVEMSELEAKETMFSFIDTFLMNRFEIADKLIVQYTLSKIVDGDVILTFAHSRVVGDLLLGAKTNGKNFKVIVVDSRPFQEGHHLLTLLISHGITCEYVNINAAAYVMRTVTKTIVGAAGIYANGTLLSRVGTAVICTLSRKLNVPVIVCCATVKFSDRSQIDSFVFNEVGDPEALVKTTRPGDACLADVSGETLSGWRKIEKLKLLNILYDVTPSEYLTVVITEIGLIPVTSIPVVLREYSINGGVGQSSSTS